MSDSEARCTAGVSPYPTEVTTTRGYLMAHRLA
jgi:hypothetical protein